LGSILAGLIGSMTGLGGGIILIPLLTWWGFDIRQAIALSIISLLVISSTAAARYTRQHMPSVRVVAFLEFFAVIGALSGSLLTVLFGQRLLYLLCGIVFLLSSTLLWRRRNEGWSPTTGQDRLSAWLRLEGNYYDAVEGRTILYQGQHALVGGLLTIGAGLVSGLMGVGGSALTVLINNVVIGLPPKVALTTSHLVMSVAALASADVCLELGLIPSELVMPMIVGVALGAHIGSGMIVHLRNRTVRNFFLGMLLVLGVEMIARGLQ